MTLTENHWSRFWSWFSVVYSNFIQCRICGSCSKIFFSNEEIKVLCPPYILNMCHKIKKFSGDLRVLNTVLGIVVEPPKSTQLGFWAKEVFNQVGEGGGILKNMRLAEDRIYWQWTKSQSGCIPKCMAQATLILSIFWFDVPLKVLWPILTCGQWLNAGLLTQSSLLRYIITKTTVRKYSV